MPKLKLVLADRDERYIDSLERYLRNSCGKHTDIYVFTRQDALEAFLQDSGSTVDILVVSGTFMSDLLTQSCVKCMALLVETKDEECGGNEQSLYKYQAGERLHSRLMEMYAAVDGRTPVRGKERETTPLLSVFSAQGGSGKSVIAAHLALYYARLGLRAFLLSLDPVSSLPLFFSPTVKGLTFSDVLYYLKHDGQNLTARLRTAPSCDEEAGVSYLLPAECALDMEDITGEELLQLLSALCDMGKYDVMVTDLPAAVNRKSFSMLTASDAVLWVLSAEAAAQYKTKQFEEQAGKILRSSSAPLFEKTIPVMNRFSVGHTEAAGFFAGGHSVHFKIPFLPDIYSHSGGTLRLNTESSMAGHIRGPAAALLERVRIPQAGR